ncbi:Holliday junction DNA helicase RuvA [Aequitasia blattaphilus]|uniref:Holliday junction branch migration complex subunit RuvA n=1 Tax=Aequitasia blattaphilus TaxID=2949332 RepID=A0ABT1E5J3_9FIRM|nr:Holliday junction branch migration protein RuvA [Aequitasia blattaphilus]MCP1101112.1 Holliday junction branch migration protein RuvA [Aequitasia blattaphilus]MCR8613752.1 Holliday junction branch migration protein RuvA [Aequitasia blattaphilus]
MIAYVKGRVEGIYDTGVVVDVRGIGYFVFMSPAAMSVLPKGEEVKIHTYMNVKEDAMQLFGFLTREDLDIFKLIIGVNGIGPKGGQQILSVLTPEELRFAVLSKDAKAIAKAPGIGKKTAEKLILELSDKIHVEDTLEIRNKEGAYGGAVIDPRLEESILAMAALGYDNGEAIKAVKKIKITDDMTVEAILKQALKNIMM